MLPMVTDSTCPAHSAAGVRALTCRLLGLYTLSCRAFSYSTTQRHNSTLRLNASWIDFLLSLSRCLFKLRALLYLYNPMVCRPWVDFSNWHYIYKSKGRQPYDYITTSRSTHTNRGVFIIDLVKTWALSPKTCLGGIPHPTGPQHKHRDSPSSLSISVEIFVRRPPNST